MYVLYIYACVCDCICIYRGWGFMGNSHCQVWLRDGIWIISTWFHMFGSIVYTGMCPQSLNVQGIILTKPKRRNSRRLRPLGDQRSKCFKGSFPVTRISLRTVPFGYDPGPLDMKKLCLEIQVFHLHECLSYLISLWHTMATAKKQWDSEARKKKLRKATVDLKQRLKGVVQMVCRPTFPPWTKPKKHQPRGPTSRSQVATSTWRGGTLVAS